MTIAPYCHRLLKFCSTDIEQLIAALEPSKWDTTDSCYRICTWQLIIDYALVTETLSLQAYFCKGGTN